MSAGTPDGGPAFPVTIDNKTGKHPVEDFMGADVPIGACTVFAGISTRDYFAAKSLPAAHAMAEKCYRDSPEPITVARWAYELADAMLQARQE